MPGIVALPITSWRVRVEDRLRGCRGAQKSPLKSGTQAPVQAASTYDYDLFRSSVVHKKTLIFAVPQSRHSYHIAAVVVTTNFQPIQQEN
jgi:hypothetical protein